MLKLIKYMVEHKFEFRMVYDDYGYHLNFTVFNDDYVVRNDGDAEKLLRYLVQECNNDTSLELYDDIE